ncbi:MAG: hypothetical protein LBH32_11975 [Dysgonamonadaceae bacterium]|jgi:hypothetical protein|nr:hypothetical protein [Dysgonamonadaceae bacterium]
MKKFVFLALMATFFTTCLNAQNNSSSFGTERPSLYIGIGGGFDYGGYGGKVEFLPVKNLGLFAGVGYNFLSAGWNIGGSFLISPDANICPKISAMYGYNAVLMIENAEDLNKTSYGVTFGAGIDWKIGLRGNKISLAINVPIRSSEFNDHYDNVKNNPRVEMKNDLWPIGISIGYHFVIK